MHGQIPNFDNLFECQAQQAQKFREQQEELRRRHIDELRSKDMDRRAQVFFQFPERHFFEDNDNKIKTFFSSV